MDETRADLRAYYEQEAIQRTRKPLTGRRVEIRAEFIAMLASEGRCRVLDLGAGPGGDGQAFVDAGCTYVGLDLAHGNGVLAAERGITVIQGSLTAPPFRAGAFDAGWSMSTLMHLPEEEVPQALMDMIGPLSSGAPLMVGLWGGERQDVITASKTGGEQRLFSYRPLSANQQLLEAAGPVERADSWDVVPGGAERGLQYQLFLIRVEH